MTRKSLIEKFRGSLNSGTGAQLRQVYINSRRFDREVEAIRRDMENAVAANKRRAQISGATGQLLEAEPKVSARPPTGKSADLTLRDEVELALITFVKRLGFVAIIFACIALVIALF